jgi:hypothetical protein
MLAARRIATESGIEVAASARAISRCRTQSARSSSSSARNGSHLVTAAGEALDWTLMMVDMGVLLQRREWRAGMGEARKWDPVT